MELEADDEIAEVDAAVPVTSTAPVPAPVARTVAAVVPALDEAGEPGQRTEANAGEEVGGEPDVHMEENVGGEVAEEGTVAANAEEVVEVPSGDDAIALLEARGIRLENVELEGSRTSPLPKRSSKCLSRTNLGPRPQKTSYASV